MQLDRKLIGSACLPLVIRAARRPEHYSFDAFLSHRAAISDRCSGQGLQNRGYGVIRADGGLSIQAQSMSAVRFENEIHWDGNSITVWANLNGSRIFCEIPRSTIHEVTLLGDAISGDVGRDRAEIFDRLRPAVVAKIARTRGSSIRLHPSDLS